MRDCDAKNNLGVKAGVRDGRQVVEITNPDAPHRADTVKITGKPSSHDPFMVDLTEHNIGRVDVMHTKQGTYVLMKSAGGEVHTRSLG